MSAKNTAPAMTLDEKIDSGNLSAFGGERVGGYPAEFAALTPEQRERFAVAQTARLREEYAARAAANSRRPRRDERGGRPVSDLDREDLGYTPRR